MKVLGICSFAGLGGCERSFALLLEALPADVERSALIVGDGPLRSLLEEKAIPVAATPGFEGRPGPRELVRFTGLLRRQLRTERPGVVWASGHKAALLATPACRLAGVPLVWHKVDFSWDRLLARPLAMASSGVTAVSVAATRPIGRLATRRVLGVVAPPVSPDLSARRNGWPEAPTIGTLGRLVPYKGHHRVLEAAALLSEEFPRLRVVIAGGPVPQYPGYPAELAALAERLELSDRVELTGLVDDIATVLPRLSVFVNATYRDSEGYGLEGRGRAIIEASWYGLPVVASQAGGAAESIIDGRTGTLVGDSQPRLLADAIRPYLGDPGLATRVGDAGSDYARSNFAAEPLGQLLCDRLRQVAAEDRA
jgi:glycosyltransferase involved in cell wall biosynthesis